MLYIAPYLCHTHPSFISVFPLIGSFLSSPSVTLRHRSFFLPSRKHLHLWTVWTQLLYKFAFSWQSKAAALEPIHSLIIWFQRTLLKRTWATFPPRKTRGTSHLAFAQVSWMKERTLSAFIGYHGTHHPCQPAAIHLLGLWLHQLKQCKCGWTPPNFERT